jgi:hypothetical protein
MLQRQRRELEDDFSNVVELAYESTGMHAIKAKTHHFIWE